MSNLRDLKKDYQSYVDACLASKAAVMPYNSWLQCKLIDLEKRLEIVEQVQRDNEAGK